MLFRRATGRQVEAALQRKCSIAQCLPPMMAEAAELTEEVWRFGVAAAKTVDVVGKFGYENIGQFHTELQAGMLLNMQVSTHGIPSMLYKGYESHYCSTTLHLATDHMAKDLPHLPGKILAHARRPFSMSHFHRLTVPSRYDYWVPF
jgi:hypothetical protein